jgi:uncharacterized membrane protein YbhN (UPF0104 family)
MTKQIAKLTLKISFTFIALWVVYSKVDLTKVIEITKNSSFLYLFIALFLFNISQIVSSFRHLYILSLIDVYIEKFENIKLYYAGMFYNTFLPGGIGGDGYKLYYIKKNYNQNIKPILQSLLLDRGAGLGGLLLILGILFLFSKYVNDTLFYLDVLALVLLYPSLYFVIKFMFKSFVSGFLKYNIYSFIIQALQVLSALFIVLAIGENYIIEFLVLFLISSVVSIIPISFGGIGLRELTFIYGLSILEINSESGVSFSFLFLIITLISSFVGILFKLEKK